MIAGSRKHSLIYLNGTELVWIVASDHRFIEFHKPIYTSYPCSKLVNWSLHCFNKSLQYIVLGHEGGWAFKAMDKRRPNFFFNTHPPPLDPFLLSMALSTDVPLNLSLCDSNPTPLTRVPQEGQSPSRVIERSRFPWNIDIPWNIMEYGGILWNIAEYCGTIISGLNSSWKVPLYSMEHSLEFSKIMQ